VGVPLGHRTPTLSNGISTRSTVASATGPGVRPISRQWYGVLWITAHGHLRLPVAVRRAARLEVRDQVLLAADTSHGLLVVYPPRAIDEMVARRFAEGLDGDAS
jgi:hypothetical protein